MSIGVGHAHHRRVQRLEPLLHDDRGELRADSERLDVFVHDQEAARLLHRRKNCRLVVRHQRSQIDHFHLDALFGKAVRGFERGGYHRAVGHERGVGARTPDGGNTYRNNLIPFGHRSLGAAIQVFVLHVDDRVVVADRRFEQALGVPWRRRRNDFQAGAMNEPAFGVLRMIQTAADVAAAWRAHDDGARHAAAGAIAQRGGLIDNLIETAGDEVGELHLRHRTVAALGRADADADDR